MNLKDRKLQEAKTKLKVLEEKLKFLEFSNLQDKEEKIIDCKHAIEKQKRIIRIVDCFYFMILCVILWHFIFLCL